MHNKQNINIAPDLQTRESVIFAGGRGQFAVTRPDGKTMYVKVESKAKDLPGSSKRYTPVSFGEATHVFFSEKGFGTPKLGTYYPPGRWDGRFFTDLPPDHPHLEAIDVVIGYVTGKDLPEGYGITVESRCGLCGHKLEDPESVKRGMGPDCADSPTGTRILKASVFGQGEFDLEAAMEDQGATVEEVVRGVVLAERSAAEVKASDPEEIAERLPEYGPEAIRHLTDEDLNSLYQSVLIEFKRRVNENQLAGVSLG